jgi:hypothetical protein
VTALADVLSLLASVAPRVSWQTLAPLAAVLLVACAWLDHEGSR